MKQTHRPLDGIVAIDSTSTNGELGSRLLADLGATVVKVEPPGGAPSRHNGPFSPDGTSLWFAYRNANKSAEAVDVTTQAGRARLDALLAAADIWFDSTGPEDVLASFEPEAVLERHPHLVVVTVTPFGYSGPYRGFQATDLVCNALSGMLYKGGVVEEPPLTAPGTFCSDVAGVTAAFAALAAHRQATLTGQGQHVDLSLQEAVAQVTDWGMPNGSAMKLLGFEYPRVRAGSGPAYPIFPCADGFVRLIVLSPPAWKEMRAWLGNPEWLDDPSYDSLVGRILVEDVLGLLYRELFADRTKMELAHEAQRRGIALTPVLSLREAMESEHAMARGSFPVTDMSATVQGRAPAGFFAIDGERCGIRTTCPDPGAGAPALSARSAPAPAAHAPKRPLEGIRVLDFGIGGVGVEAGRMLADYGADVIKVETRTYPDFIRVLGGTEMSASFASSNRNKRSFGVNAKTDDGRAVLCRLIESADVVIENGSVGAMDSIGLGYDRLREMNRALVIVSSQLMGSTGPWSSWMGYGPSSRTVAGLTWLWNYPGRDEPTESAAIHPDHVCGRLVAVAALAGLHGRQTTGSGCHAEVTQYEAVTALLGEFFLSEDLRPGSVQPSGNDSAEHAPWGVYPCAGEERWCAICVRSDEEWQRLVEVLGRPDWALDPQLKSAEGRVARRGEVDSRLGDWTRERADTEVMDLLQAVGIPAGRLVDSLELSSDPQLSYRGFPQVIDQPGLGDVWLEGPAFHASGMPDPELRPAPALGAHTRELCQELGLSDGEIDDLVAAGALEEDIAG